MSHRLPFALAALLLCATQAHAQTFAFQVVPSQSSVDVAASLDQLLPGTVIGDYDALSNPRGTRTLPGLFGGSGNQPVPMDITFQAALAAQGAPTGSFAA